MPDVSRPSVQHKSQAVRSLAWSPNQEYLAAAGDFGQIAVYHTNTNEIGTIATPPNRVNCVSWAPTSRKLAFACEDLSLSVVDFTSQRIEQTWRGHGADVLSVAWHQTRGLLASSAKERELPVKLWDPRSGSLIAPLCVRRSAYLFISSY